MYPRPNIPPTAPAHRDPEDLRDGFPSPGMLEVTAASGSDVPDSLANAIDVVSRAADEHRTGILISRIGLDRYIVRAHPGVPYGLIREAFE